MARTALVTGGAGFIGGHLVGRLLKDGWNVRVLDNFSSSSGAGLRAFSGDIETIQADIRDADACSKACTGIDSVFHMAAVASVVISVNDPLYAHDVNVNGTLNLLMAARERGVRRLVFSSSASVYGNADCVPTDEQQPLHPESPYATQKAAGELYCRNFYDLYRLETVVLRYFNVFGPGQSPNSSYAAVIPRWVDAARRGEAPVVYGDGHQTRDFVYVGNVVSANLRAVTSEGAAGRAFNVASGEGISLLRLLSDLEQVTGSHLRPEFRPGRPGEIRHSRADISTARRVLGYEPITSFNVGLRHTIEATLGVPPTSMTMTAVA